jgi:hypothetical protein
MVVSHHALVFAFPLQISMGTKNHNGSRGSSQQLSEGNSSSFEVGYRLRNIQSGVRLEHIQCFELKQDWRCLLSNLHYS